LAQTLAQLQEEIAQLEAQSEKLHEEAATVRAQELKTVVDEVIATIAEYDITAAQLGFKAISATGKTTRKAMYADGKGNTWGGRGKRPNWLKQSGGDIDRFRI
jgi:DNA-binding protein H-NS